ncbi:acyltransferase family protein [Klebsiella aerogenes]
MSNLSISVDEYKKNTIVGFRHDLNVLRTVAIFSVVIYHFLPDQFPGGFAGVDVFFVISGFLMTSIIMGKTLNGKFSYYGFFCERFRRIAPALFVMATTLSLAFWFWLPTVEYKKVASYVGYVILFISNIKLNKESGNYFTSDMHENWFLHTWSLSVEWQFYLILPIIITTTLKYGKKDYLPYIFLVLGGISFFSCLYFYSKFTSNTFYLLQYRAWEMLAGGVTYFISRKMKAFYSTITFIVGLLIILLSILLLDNQTAWPGILTTLPVIGTILCIVSNNQLLSSRIDNYFGLLGLSSYSIYLWHWPVAVLLVYANKNHNLEWILAGIIISVALGFISWKKIELPIKKFLTNLSDSNFLKAITLSICTLYIFSYTIKNQIIVNSPNPKIEAIASEAYNKNFAEDLNTHLSYYGTGPLKALIVGDSHAVATATALATAVGTNGSVVGLTFSGCPNIAFGLRDEFKKCIKFNEELPNRLQQFDSDAPVFMVSRASHYIDTGVIDFKAGRASKLKADELYTKAFTELACRISQNHKVFVVNPIPEMSVNVPRHISHLLMMGYDVSDVYTNTNSYKYKNSTVLSAHANIDKKCNIEVLNPLNYLCKNGACYGSQDLQPLYFDDNHLSQTGNKKLIPMFSAALTQ